MHAGLYDKLSQGYKPARIDHARQAHQASWVSRHNIKILEGLCSALSEILRTYPLVLGAIKRLANHKFGHVGGSHA